MARANKVEAVEVELAPVVTGPKLVSVAPATVRAGTARAAAYEALQVALELGATRQETLIAVKAAEQAWHIEQGRTPKGINPAGWLSLFGAVFE